MIPDRVNFSTKEYDLLVVGGGINGAAIANIAAENGLKAALVEKGDFASGTSSKSTKLIHGGLRYLEHLEFDLVRESLKERFIQLKSAPHLVKPLEFVVPVYKTDPRPLWLMRLGVFLYDILGGKYLVGPHRSLQKQEIKDMIPGIKEEGLLGGVTYFDARMDDARLCLENILSAKEKGADVSNYVEVVAFLKKNGRVIGVRTRGLINSRETEIRARKIVCAVGPWTNRVSHLENPSARKRIRATKGVHIVYKEKISDKALLLQTRQDRRFFFIIPSGNHSLIGTTDTDYDEHPDKVAVEDSDIDYLFEEAAQFFPGIAFRKGDIITAFAGLRPLVNVRGRPSEVSRRHVIKKTRLGIIYVIGGKYTTYRKIAEECVKKVFGDKAIKPFTGEYVLYGNSGAPGSAPKAAGRHDVDDETLEYLQSQYGTRYRDVLELTQEKPELNKKICSCSPAIAAQIVYAIKTEMACNAEDVIWRRLGLGYHACATQQCREEIKKHFRK